MVYLGGKAGSIEEGMQQCRSALWSGRAYEKFLEIVRRQGGDASILAQPARYPAPAHTAEVRSRAAGYVTGFDTMRLGLLAIALGAGRTTLGETIDPKAGIILAKKIGDKVAKNDLLATIMTDREDVLDRAVRECGACIRFGETVPPPRSAIIARIDRDGVHPWTTPMLN